MNDQERQTVGNRRAAYRVALGLTQRQLADLAGVSVPVIVRAENGAQITEDSLRAIAKALGITASEYLEPKAYATLATPVAVEGGGVR